MGIVLLLSGLLYESLFLVGHLDDQGPGLEGCATNQVKRQALASSKGCMQLPTPLPRN